MSDTTAFTPSMILVSQDAGNWARVSKPVAGAADKPKKQYTAQTEPFRAGIK